MNDSNISLESPEQKLARSAAFNKLKPVCVKLIQEQTPDNVVSVLQVIEQIDKDSLHILQEYIIFPFRFILMSAPRSETLVMHVIDGIADIFSKTKVSSWKLFQDVFVLIMSIIGHPKDHGAVADVSEELKLAVIKCFTVMLEQADDLILLNVYSPQFLPQLGHAVYILLKIAEAEKSRQIRIAAIGGISAIGLAKKEGKEHLEDKAGASLSHFLPGTSITLSNIISGDSVQGHIVTVAALEAWCSWIVLVVGDVSLEVAEKANNKGTESDDTSRLSPIIRNKEWIMDTGKNLHLAIQKILDVVCHNHWKVRFSLVEFAKTLLQKCSKSLHLSLGSLFEILLTLSADEMSNVSKSSQRSLQDIAYHCKVTEPLFEILEDNLYNLTTELPRIMNSSDDSKKLKTLHLFTGYLQLFGSGIRRLLLSLPHLERLGLCLIQLTELDCSNTQLVAERTGIPDAATMVKENLQTLSPAKKNFKHFKDENIYCQIKAVCHLLGYYGDLSLLLDHTLELFHRSSMYRKQAVLLLNEFIIGASGLYLDKDVLLHTFQSSKEILNNEANRKDNEDLLPEAIRNLLMEYIQPSYWMLPTVNEDASEMLVDKSTSLILRTEDPSISTTVAKLNSNILFICLMLEGIGNFSRILGTNYSPLLMKVLYPVLEKMGNKSALVSHTAYCTLDTISKSCSCNSISDLILKHSDYLVNSLSLKLQHFHQNPEAPLVLKVAISNSSPEILPVFNDSLEELFFGLDHYHDKKTKHFLEAINATVAAINQWFPSKGKPNKAEKQENSTSNASYESNWNLAVVELQDFYLNYHALKLTSEGNLDIESKTFGTVKEEEESTSNDEKKECPLHVKIIIQVLERCSHLLAMTELNVCLLVLDTIEKGISALKDWEDHLLPLVHKLWQPFCGRFFSNFVLTRKAFETLCLMAESCGSFIYKRTMTDLWKKILNFLEKQALISSSKNNKVYNLTAAYKLQLTILNNIGILVKKLKIKEQELDTLATVCILYLSHQQPVPLQKVAVNLMELLIQINPDIIWLKLTFVMGAKQCLNPPHPCFTSLKVLHNRSTDVSEYQENIIPLLERILHPSNVYS